jgi:hypothetical protein
MSDFNVTYHGSIYLLEPLTDAALHWVDANLPTDRLSFGDAVVVEHRYIRSIVTGIRADGLGVA